LSQDFATHLQKRGGSLQIDGISRMIREAAFKGDLVSLALQINGLH